MKKFFYIFAFILSINILIVNVYAYVDTVKEETSFGEEINVMTFNDYEPFGKIINGFEIDKIDSIFLPALKEFAENKKYHLKSKQELENDDLTNVRSLRVGDFDLIIGMYHATKFYNGIEYIFPAVINNPVHVAMMPDKIDQVKTVDDIKNLKGVRVEHERFSDYIEHELNNFNIEKVEDLNKAYEKIFIGEADYIIGGYYYMLMEAIRLGVRPYVKFSQKPLWDMPVFIGVSKATKLNKNLLVKLLSTWSNNPATKEKIRQSLQDKIKGLEDEFAGAVPPMYIRHDDTLSAAGFSANPIADTQPAETTVYGTSLEEQENLATQGGE